MELKALHFIVRHGWSCHSLSEGVQHCQVGCVKSSYITVRIDMRISDH
jgi:hypothetical protein